MYFSAVSIAEIAIKASLGKLDAPTGTADTLLAGGFTELPFRSAHAEALRELPWHHRDPFDRMLIAQARCEGLVLATVEQHAPAYGIALL